MRGVSKVFYLLFAVAAIAATAAFATPAEDFAKANELYEKGDFQSATAIYQKLVTEHPDEAAYHYNLGNSYAKTGRTGKAVASYLRAFRLAPRSSDSRHNLDFMLARAGEELVPQGIPNALFILAYSLSADELSGLFWLAFWAFFLSWGAYLLDSRLRAAGPVALVSLVLVGLFGGWKLMRGTLEPSETAVVLRPDAEVRNGPGANFSVGYTLPEGRRVGVIDKKGDWLEINTPKEGFKGWIKKEYVEKV